MSNEIIAEGVRLCLEKNLTPEKIDLSSIIDNMSKDALRAFARRGLVESVEKALNKHRAKRGASHPSEGRNPDPRWAAFRQEMNAKHLQASKGLKRS